MVQLLTQTPNDDIKLKFKAMCSAHFKDKTQKQYRLSMIRDIKKLNNKGIKIKFSQKNEIQNFLRKQNTDTLHITDLVI